MEDAAGQGSSPDPAPDGPLREPGPPQPRPSEPAPPRSRARARIWIVTGIVAALVIGLGLAWTLRPTAAPTSASAPSPTATRTPTPTPIPTPTPTPEGFAANTASYDLQSLPPVNVFEVNPSLPVDDDPYGSFTGEAARSRDWGSPVFADPTGQPVAYLPRDFLYDGTTVPIVQRQAHWVKVLLTGRQAVPSQGNPAQLTGWLRVQDVDITPLDSTVEVSISARTIDIWRAGTPTRVATDFGWGRSSTPTPLGRTFVMTVRTDPSLWYTRGHPLVYLSVQSPTLDGFAGSSVAVTAFHYHDERSGSVSNGCLRVDPDAITALAQLPVGTPVFIRQ